MKSILIAERDHELVGLLRFLFNEQTGFRIVELSDWQGVLHKSLEINPDVLIVNITLIENSHKIAEQLKANPVLKSAHKILLIPSSQLQESKLSVDWADSVIAKTSDPTNVIQDIVESLEFWSREGKSRGILGVTMALLVIIAILGSVIYFTNAGVYIDSYETKLSSMIMDKSGISSSWESKNYFLHIVSPSADNSRLNQGRFSKSSLQEGNGESSSILKQSKNSLRGPETPSKQGFKFFDKKTSKDEKWKIREVIKAKKVEKNALNPQGKAQNVLKENEYNVRRGDHLHKLARRFESTVGELKAVNNLQRDTIYPGEILIIPSTTKQAPPLAEKHTVKKGDYLYKLARRFGTTVEELKAVNSLRRDTLYIGEVLVLPTSIRNENKENYKAGYDNKTRDKKRNLSDIKVTNWGFYETMGGVGIHSFTFENTGDLAYRNLVVKVYYQTNIRGGLNSKQLVLPIIVLPQTSKTYVKQESFSATTGSGPYGFGSVSIESVEILEATPLANVGN